MVDNEEQPEVEDQEILDPKNSARRYWRDPHSGTQREIWRPGDGDGDVEHDHFERKGPVAPIDKRWRLYQLSPGTFKHRINEPPSNVILDDRAVYEVLQSNIPRAQLSKRWSHDFSGQANVRHRRPHRGRPAYKDEQAEDDNDKYESIEANRKNPSYLFTGEKDFTPVFYSELPKGAEPTEPDPEDESEDDSPKKPKQHNQYTAPHLLVRNGAESQSQTKGKYRARVNTFLRRDPEPDWVKDRQKLFGGVGIGRTSSYTSSPLAQDLSFGFNFPTTPAPANSILPEESLWVEQDDDEVRQDDDEVRQDDEDDDDDIMPSIFDNPSTSAAQPSSTKRPAPSDTFPRRPKKTKPMGYIERLAAGLLDEQPHAEAEEQNVATAEARQTSVVADLHAELETARSALSDRDRRISELEAELQELKAMVASGEK